MKRRVPIIGLVLATFLIVLPGLAQIEPETVPEFYFTRLVYENGGGPARTPIFDFRCTDLAAGEGGTRAGRGWGTDFPASDCKFMWGVQRLTNIRVYDKSPHLVTALDPKLFEYPYLYIVSPHRMYLTSEEAQNLREYLLRGGFLHVDDFWGLEQRGAVEEEMGKIFPDRQMVKLGLDHEVFHTFFDVDTVMQIPNVNNACNGRQTWEQRSEIDPMIFGISDDDGRLMVIITYNSDLGDAWEWMDLPCYPQKYSGQAYRMGLNFMIYAMSH
ncbi:MAG TPA: DUF4159 domain-containing protein [Terriglobia bacterium]|nr:DUF4159 domain-containing protein [Terriglobia bacterium]